jgi:hypothetical protein
MAADHCDHARQLADFAMIQIKNTASPAQARDSLNLFAALRSLGFAICFVIVTTTVFAQPTLLPNSGAITR